MGRRSLAVVWICLMIAVAARAQAQGLDEFVRAKAYCIMDADTGKVLSSLNPQMMLPPASTLKVGTALIAVTSLKLTDTVPVSCHASEAQPSKLKIQPGETYSVHDLLYAVLLASANDAARALAEKVSGSEERFAGFMTSRLRQMGAYRTNFETASGLPQPGQYSTAYDLALIFRKAIENPTLAKIMNTKTYTLTDGKTVRNHNRFLFTTDYAVSGKTGWTRSSQHTYVGLFQNGEKRIIVALMGSPNKWPDLRILIAKGFSEIGAPIAALPPLEERLQKTEDGYALAGNNSLCPPPGRYKNVRPRSGHQRYLRESTSKRSVVKASIASRGGRSLQQSSSSQGQKKKSSKAKASSISCSKSRS
jgi:serine-type D-Ala-D-Ala carboxypeptidase (penicillin-binding protein 5/6)